MIQPLRKLHRRIFWVLAVLLPLLFIAGLLLRHRQLVPKVTPANGHSTLPANASTPILTASYQLPTP